MPAVGPCKKGIAALADGHGEEKFKRKTDRQRADFTDNNAMGRTGTSTKLDVLHAMAGKLHSFEPMLPSWLLPLQNPFTPPSI